MKENIFGFSFANFRSFASNAVYLDHCEKINLIIGENNSGKSNILGAIETLLPSVKCLHRNLNQDVKINEKITDLDINNTTSMTDIKFTLYIDPDKLEYENSFLRKLHRLKSKGDAEAKAAEALEGCPILMSPARRAVGYRCRVTRQSKATIDPDLIDELADQNKSKITHKQWELLARNLTNALGDTRANIQGVLHSLNPYANITIPQTHYITAVREKSNSNRGDDRDRVTGQGLIQELARRQEPSASETQLLDDFNRINKFVKAVSEDDSAEIRIPYERDTIIISSNGSRLPLEYVGTGVHEVIIIAAEAIVNEGRVFLVEEPEIHMHPLLQRRLLRFLYEETDNQYFVATHSPHFMGVVESSVYRVTPSREGTQVDIVDTDNKRSKICIDLGYRPSDLVQANAIIWVEGLTDRWLVRYWMSKVDPTLKEGLHYSVMFYGGRLLSHLSADEEVVEDFIEVLKLNRFSAIIIDSDKKKARSRINRTKERIRGEAERQGALCWITKGREIENYIEKNVLEESLSFLYPNCVIGSTNDPYEIAYRIRNKKGQEKAVDKMRLAKTVIEKGASLNKLDLRKQTRRLHKFIKEANRLV